MQDFMNMSCLCIIALVSSLDFYAFAPPSRELILCWSNMISGEEDENMDMTFTVYEGIFFFTYVKLKA